MKSHIYKSGLRFLKIYLRQKLEMFYIFVIVSKSKKDSAPTPLVPTED